MLFRVCLMQTNDLRNQIIAFWYLSKCHFELRIVSWLQFSKSTYFCVLRHSQNVILFYWEFDTCEMYSTMSLRKWIELVGTWNYCILCLQRLTLISKNPNEKQKWHKYQFNIACQNFWINHQECQSYRFKIFKFQTL